MSSQLHPRVVGMVVGTLLIAGCGGDSATSPSKTPNSETTSDSEASLQLDISSPDDNTKTGRATITVVGRVTPGSNVRVAGRRASVRGGSFRRRVPLHARRNTIRIEAQLQGFKDAVGTLVVIRKPRPKPTPAPTATPEPTSTPAPDEADNCDPNYEGACLDPGSSDYDCEGGSGDGPDYTGTVQVVGDDHFDLDRDGDGIACDI